MASVLRGLVRIKIRSKNRTASTAYQITLVDYVVTAGMQVWVAASLPS
jgi:hypothetical protein